MTNIHYVIIYRPGSERVAASVFFVDDEAGTVHGLYFGDAGGGTSDEAYFRMEVSAGSVGRFLECDNPEDPAFRVDRAGDRRRRLPPLSAVDAAVFAELRSYRQTWWTFEEDDHVRMLAGRAGSMSSLGSELYARSPGLDDGVLGLIRRHWRGGV